MKLIKKFLTFAIILLSINNSLSNHLRAVAKDENLQFQIIEKNSNKCLDLLNKKTADKTVLALGTCNLKEKRQYWFVKKISEDSYVISNVETGFTVNPLSGVHIISDRRMIMTKSSGKPSTSQQFTFTKQDSDGFMMVTNKGNNQCMDAQGQKVADNTEIISYPCKPNQKNQYWKFVLIV